MITIVYSTHKDNTYNENFKKQILNSVGLKNVQILEYQNNNEFSLSQIYNKGISESLNDIVVCIHNDIKLEKNWGKKILKEFSNNPDFGIIGLAGSCYFPESGVYWQTMDRTMVGQVYHEPVGQKKWLSVYSNKFPFLIPVITVDGLFISFNKTKIKHKFDESIPGFHFYDHGFCLPNYLDGVNIGVSTSIEVTHQSIGAVAQDFFETRDLFVSKYKNILPLDLRPKEIHYQKTTPKKIKSNEKIAIVIPTKGLVDVLITCLDSFYEHCDESNFHFFIGDTGSTDDEKNRIKDYIKNKNNITLIEYDWYQYSKTNNAIVKEYVTDDFTYILFANNDIKILNDVVYKMYEVFKTNSKTGTVGCRLHYPDNTLQHGSVIMTFNKQNNSFNPTHEFLGSYYRYFTNKKSVLGNTAALMMIRKKVFDKLGGFNENYLYHFEDVDLNLSCLNEGLINFFEGSAVAYHFESQSKKIEGIKMDLAIKDFHFLNHRLYNELKKSLKIDLRVVG